MKKHVIISRHISAFLLILLFLMAVVVYFFAYQKVFIEQKEIQTEKSIELTENQIFAKEQLDLEQDINRFIEVYFEQNFTDKNEQLKFVQIEYVRFLDYQLTDTKNQDLLVQFVTILGTMVDKIAQNNFNLELEENELRAYYKKIEI